MTRLRWSGRRAVTLAAVLAVAAAGVATVLLTAGGADRDPIVVRDVGIDVRDGPNRDEYVRLDATVYLPRRTPAPAILLAHGFGGSKESVVEQARELAGDGFVVLAYTARGFGRSTGQIALNSPDYEVVDAQALVDWLAARPEVRTDRPGDPRIGVSGSSYGGALALMLAGTDRRIDAVVPMITWNDLSAALLPNAAGAGP
ncbi:MAG TPA: alpha/beta fold hydrolase, partial [Pseudonocardiaceae bacterium]|nr:alpha/beta fold hydrolase [Pseudonocardiaceae bacterium]